MKIVKSYSARISGNKEKLYYLKNTLNEIEQLSKYVFDLGKDKWFDQKELYKDCRNKFPNINSKVTQKFLQLYQPKKGKKLPKKPISPSIIIDQNFDFQINNSTKLTSFWLKFHRKKFPVFGKYLKTRILESKNIKLIQIFERDNNLYCKFSYVVDKEEFKYNSSKCSSIDVNTKRHVLLSFNNKSNFYNLKQLYHRKHEHSKKHNQQHRNIENYTKDQLHKLTSKIVKDLLSNKSEVLILEDLKHLRKSASRKNKTSKGKKLNFIINSFPFYMFQNFLEYKCLDHGIKVVKIDPSYTSKTCSRCGSLNTERPHQEQFICSDCNLNLDADLNGSRNILQFYKNEVWVASESNPVSDLQTDMKPLALAIG